MTIIVGDCVEAMLGMETGSVDAIVTDPPYHLTKTNHPVLLGYARETAS